MTREQLLKHWAVIEAFRNGKQVQCFMLNPNQWRDTTDPAFLLHYEYRIKPEPKKMWVNVYPAGVLIPAYGHHTREGADNGGTPGRIACVEVTYTEGEGL